jgi:glutamate dehydrogenase/leucine dehydrogenase
MRVAVQGFGNVGEWTCRFLAERGAKVVAVSDITGGVYCDTGIPIDRLSDYVLRTGGLAGCEGDPITNEQLLGLEVDMLIPAAIEAVVTEEIAQKVAARLVVEAANGPTTASGEKILNARGIPIVPDILANAGGVTASYVEWRQAKSGAMTKAEETYDTVAEQLEVAFHRVREVAAKHQVTDRIAAQVVAVGELVATMRDRGWLPLGA